MADSFLDHIPSHEREKIKKRLRSPEEYERLREKVRGPEDLEREMEKNAEFAEARLALESDRRHQEKAQEMVKDAMKEKGSENVLEAKTSEEVVKALKEGRFEVTVTENQEKPALSVKLKNSSKSGVNAPSGNVSEVYALKPLLQQQILSSFTLKNTDQEG